MTALLEAAAAEDDEAGRDPVAAADLPGAVPLLEDLSAFDPCLRW